MSARPAPARTRPARPRSRRQPPSRATIVRRWLLLLGAVGVAATVVFLATAPFVDKAVHEVTLPLRHDDIIRQQARDKGLDPALIAAVIYTESRFRDQTSNAGAKGLMQLMPRTADYIARKSGGTAFVQGDLATPQVNISYGSWYLRYLLDKYGGNTILALAAYNAGEGKVDGWWRDAAARGERFRIAAHIPFPETRNYVTHVLQTRRAYRREYARELGL
jgi:soluble lytic murein transglycosylase